MSPKSRVANTSPEGEPRPQRVTDPGTGLSAIRFAGGQYCQFDAMPAQTIFVVNCLASDASTRAGLIGGHDQDLGIRYYDIPDGWSKWIASEGHKGAVVEGDKNDFANTEGKGQFFVNGGKTYDVARGQWHVVSAARDARYDALKVRLGGYFTGRDFKGDIAEVLVYSRLVDDDQRKSVEQYLSSKWMIPRNS